MSERIPGRPALFQALMALAVTCALVLGPSPVAAAEEVSADIGAPVFLVAPPDGYEHLSDALADVGARVLHEFPPDAAVAEGGEALVTEAVSGGWALYAFIGDVPDELLPHLTPGAQRAAGAWSALRAPSAIPVPADLDAPFGDARSAPDRAVLSPQALDPSLYQQSEYLIGKVAVNLVLVESDGSVDASTENWTPGRQQKVFEQVVQALSWWQARSPRANLQFVYEDHYSSPVPVSYEPISRPHFEDRLWISEAMQRLGFGHSSYITATRLFNRDTRERHGADWVFTIFVVDSFNDTDNRFTDGYFAYAYIHGPYMVMTYGNNGYGPDHMGAVAAHEIGHVFGALDEYAGANVPASTISGYLGVQTGNSKSGGIMDVGCIMRGGIDPYLKQQICPFTAGQVGWRDSDGDGILDPVDTAVSVAADVSIEDDGVRLVGSAIEVPYPSPLRQPLSINQIAAAQYRVNDGPWRDLPPGDGTYDSQFELFDYLLPPAPAGDWTIEVRAADSRLGAGTATSTFEAAEGTEAFIDVVVEAEVSAPEPGSPATLSGVATAPEEAGNLVAVECRLDEQPWANIPAADGSLDSAVEHFSLVLGDLGPGQHELRVRAAADDPWVGCQDWEEVITLPSLPNENETPPPVVSQVQVFVPLLASAQP